MTSNKIFKNNPVLVGGLGFVSILTATQTLKAALLMSAAVVGVLLLSTILVAILKNFIYERFKNLILMVIIVGFATGAQMLLEFYYPVSVPTMGVGIALISTNTLILHTLKNSTMKMGFGQAIVNSLLMGLAYTLVMVLVAIVRELLGMGTIYGYRLIPEAYTIPTFSGPFLAFIVLGLFVALGSKFSDKEEVK